MYQPGAFTLYNFVTNGATVVVCQDAVVAIALKTLCVYL